MYLRPKFCASLGLIVCLSAGGAYRPARADEMPDRPEAPSLAAVAVSDARPDFDALALGESQQLVDEPRPSDAERVARLQRALELDEKLLAELKQELTRPDGEYQQADAEFKTLDDQFQTKKAELKRADLPPETAVALRSELEDLQNKWELAKQRFDLAIQERKALQGNLATLEKKLERDRDALDKRLQPAYAEPVAAPPAVTTAPVADEKSSQLLTSRSAEAPLPASAASGVIAGSLAQMVPGLPVSMPPGAIAAPALAAAPAAGLAKSNELTTATQEAKRKADMARAAEAEAQSITARTELLERNIGLERTLLDMAHKKTDNAEEALASLEGEFNKQLLAGTEPAALLDHRRQFAAVDARLRAARAETRTRARQLDELHSELAALHAEQIAALKEAEVRGAEAKTAQKRVAELRNPFAPRNLLAWAIEHGPRLAGILLAMACFVWLYRSIETRMFDLLAHRTGRGTVDERENRAKTLVGVFHNAAGVLIMSGGVLMLLDEVGIPIAPLMGGAAVIGLAVAFGAQSLMKDYFSGFMILLEQQYLINDVVRIGEISGQVERITLRMTALRDLEGRVHFISHGEITRVTNLTHGWSRAVFDVGVAYSEDVDRVMNVLMDLARQLAGDPEFASVILEEPEMLGVDVLGESAVVVKFCIKTRPLKQWIVKRELLRRIKNKFDQLGIEIPFPTQTVFQRQAPSTAADNLSATESPHSAAWSHNKAA
jgi:moderate conductance mechanosensitive channel